MSAPPKLAALILAKAKKPDMGGKDMPSDSGPEAGSDAPPSDLEMAAGDIMDSVKSGDTAGLVSALQNFLSINENSENSSESSDQEPGGEGSIG